LGDCWSLAGRCHRHMYACNETARCGGRPGTHPQQRGPGVRTTITWNPGLKTIVERGCRGDAAAPVRRDPTASLLHEVVHAVQHCNGLDPTQHELEALRIENIYRRSRGFCQRTRYGDLPLPMEMAVACEPGNCGCRSALLQDVAASLAPGEAEHVSNGVLAADGTRSAGGAGAPAVPAGNE